MLVLRSESHGGLNIVRSLGCLGIPVYNLDPNRWAPAFFSKYCQGGFHSDIEHLPAGQSLRYLSEVGRQIGRRAIIIPTTDCTAKFVEDHASWLHEWFIFPNQRPGLAASLSSKREMYHLAKLHNVPTAASSFPACRDEVLAFAARAVFPVMLKGIDGQRLWEKTGKKMFILNSVRELLEKYDEAEDSQSPNLFLQEYIPGGDDTIWMFNGYFNESSECLAGFTGKKLRQCPVHTGSTSLGVCLRNDKVEEVTRRFMRELGYHGILDIGYRYDARDGIHKVLDVNPRIGSTFRLFVDDNGMDVARALYLDLTGQPVSCGHFIEGRRWMVEDLDLVSSVRYYQEGSLGVREWIASLRGIDETAFLSKDDPKPFFVMCLNRTVDLFRRIWRKISHKFRVRFLFPQVARSPATVAGEWLPSALFRLARWRWFGRRTQVR